MGLFGLGRSVVSMAIKKKKGKQRKAQGLSVQCSRICCGQTGGSQDSLWFHVDWTKPETREEDQG